MRLLKKLLLSVVSVLLSGCPDAPEEVDCTDAPTLSLVFPDADDGTVPFEAGGRLRVHVEARTCGVLGTVKGRLSVISDNEASSEVDAGKREKDLVFEEPKTGDDKIKIRRASAELRFPSGGTVSIGAVGFGVAIAESVTIVEPTIQHTEPSVELRGAQKVVAVCIESSAQAGVIEYSLVSVGIAPTAADTRSQNLIEGPCDDGTGASHATIIADVAGERVLLNAKLQGTNARLTSEILLAITSDPPKLTACFNQSEGTSCPESAGNEHSLALPTSGQLLPFRLEVTQEGQALSGFTVTAAGLNAGEIWPSTLTTNGEGVVEGYLLSPPASVLILDWVGTGYGSLAVSTLRREGPAIEFETASDDGEYTPGALIEYHLRLTRGGEPAGGEVVALTSLPPGVAAESLTTDAQGRAVGFFLAPDGPSLMLKATQGALVETATYARADSLPLKLTLSFPEGTPGASGQLASEGSLVQIMVQVQRGSESVAGQVVVFSSTATVSYVPETPTTDENGMIQVFFAAPAAGELALVATAGSSTSDAVVLRR